MRLTGFILTAFLAAACTGESGPEALFSDTCATPVQNAPYISARGGGGGHGGGGHGGHGVGGGHIVGATPFLEGLLVLMPTRLKRWAVTTAQLSGMTS